MRPIRPILVSLALAAPIGACSKEQQKPVAQPAAAALSDTLRVRFETSRGPFVVEAYRSWSPLGVARFDSLVQQGFFNGVRFFRVLPGFMAQFGINGDPKVTAKWKNDTIPDEPVTHSNKRGTITFAMRGPNTRTTQFFINYADNDQLDGSFTPFGVVTQGMPAVDSLYSGYGEGYPRGNGPDQERMTAEGNTYLKNNFPKLDSIITATVVKP